MNLVIAVVLYAVVLCGFGVAQASHDRRQRLRVRAAGDESSDRSASRATLRHRALRRASSRATGS